MNLHHITLEKPSSVTHSVAGNFFSAKSHDVALIKGSQQIEIISQNLSNALFFTALSIESFSQIRTAMTFRPVGFNKDFLVITSDSGMLTVLEFIEQENFSNFEHLTSNLRKEQKYTYKIILQETVYRSGCRRIAPGSLVAKDPKGRAILLAAIEKNKIIYLTSKNGENNGINVSSPLEANIANSLTYDIIGLDNGYNNPCFVAIEADYGDLETKESAIYTRAINKSVVIYEVDLGLNQVIRKKVIPVSQNARMLLSIPVTDTIIGGFCVIFDEKVQYRSISGDVVFEINFPTRIDLYKKKKNLQIIAHASYKLKNTFYFLLQNERGDMFKLWLENPAELKLAYLCTDKISNCMALTKTNYLFKGNENTDHSVIAIVNIDSLEGHSIYGDYYIPIPISDWKVDSMSVNQNVNQMRLDSDKFDNFSGQIIKPMNKFEGMKIIQNMTNLSGIVDAKFADLTGDNIGQLYALQSGVNGSSLISLKFSFEVQKLTEITPPIRPKALFPVKNLHTQEESNKSETQYLLLTIESKTCVLVVGEKITEVTEPVGFSTEDETLHLFDLYSIDRKRVAWVQITTKEIRVVSGSNKYTQLQMGPGKKIRLATNFEDKILIINTNNQIEFFKYNSQSNEVESESRADLDQEVICLCIFGSTGRSGSLMAAIGFADSTIKIYSLDLKSSLTRLSLLVLQSSPTCIEFSDGHLLIGSANGRLNRVYVDPMTGALGEIRVRNLGSRPIKIFKNINLKMDSGQEGSKNQSNSASNQGFFICGEQTYFVLEETELFEFVSVNLNETNKIRSICPIENKIGDRCFMYITESGTMKIVQILNEKKGAYKDKSMALNHTGRKIIINKENLSLIVLESQNRVHDKLTFARKLEKLNTHLEEKLGIRVDFGPDHLKLLTFQPKHTQWASNISIINPFTFARLFTLDLPNQKHIISAQIAQFKEFENQQTLLVSVCEEHDILKNTFKNAFIIAYAFEENNKRLSQTNITKTDDICTDMHGFRGKLLVGCGSYLRLYDMGKKQLLKKCEFKKKFTLINGIKTINQRIWVSDAMDSIHLIRFDDELNQFSEVADDILPRYVTCFEILDYNTVAVGDKFGNLFVLRLVQGAEDDQVKDLASYNLRWENGYLNGAPSKFEQLCTFYDVNLITSIQKIMNVRNKFEYLLVTNIEGKVFALLPFETKSDLDFFRHFELLMRMDEDNKHFVTGRNHLLYRGYYCAVKDVTDGDLCQTFLKYQPGEKKVIEESLERTHTEILKKLEDVRFLMV